MINVQNLSLRPDHENLNPSQLDLLTDHQHVSKIFNVTLNPEHYKGILIIKSIAPVLNYAY